MERCLKRSCPGLSEVVGGANRKFSLFLWSTSFLVRLTRWRGTPELWKGPCETCPGNPYWAWRNWRQHLNSTPWTGRGDKFHHTVSDAWCLDVKSPSTDVYPFVFDNARVNRSAVTSLNPNPLPKRSLNPRAFYFCARTEKVSFYLSFNFPFAVYK